MAAGYATRMGSIARQRAEPLLEVAGAPVLSHIADRVVELEDLSEVVVITNSRFYGQFLEWASTYRAPVPLQVLDDGSTRVEDRRGAVGDLAFGVQAVPPQEEDWVVMAGDNLLGFDLHPLQQSFRRERSPLLVLRRVDHGGTPVHYNEVTLDKAGRVIRFREKPSDPETGVTAIALYFFTPGVTSLLSRYVDAGHERDAPGHFISWLVSEVPVRGSFFHGNWFDIGSPDTLEVARSAYVPST